MQTLARKNEWPLDRVNLTVDVTKKFKEEFNQPAREGAYVYGLYMEGRRPLLPRVLNEAFLSSMLEDHDFQSPLSPLRRRQVGHADRGDLRGPAKGTDPGHAGHLGASRSQRPPGDPEHLRVSSLQNQDPRTNVRLDFQP